MLDIENTNQICAANPPSLQQNAELISCEVSYIDRQKKEITLSDMSTIRYKYLIVLHGNSNLSSYEKDEALAAGIPTLSGALRIKNQTERLTVDTHSTSTQGKRTAIKAISSEQNHLLEMMLQYQVQKNPKTNLHARHVLEFQT
jgi:NADH dehydrogenase FAD-containing subunit